MITLPPRSEVRPTFRTIRVRRGRYKVDLPVPELVRQPFVYNCGVGTDSNGGLVILAGMFLLGDEDARPDLILFADTGNEKDITYNYIPVLQEWLASVNFPPLTIVKRRSKHASLGDGCMTLGTMPSLAYGGKSCSLKSKAAPMDRFLNHWEPAIVARACGLKVRKFIGYDGGKADCRRSKNEGDDKTEFIYPLREAGIVREQLTEIIKRAGLPDPGKSACYFCPASKKREVHALFQSQPDRLAYSLRMEAKAMHKTGSLKRLWSTEGLGRRWSWRETLSAEQLATLRASYDIGDVDWSHYLEHRARRDALTPEERAQIKREIKEAKEAAAKIKRERDIRVA